MFTYRYYQLPDDAFVGIRQPERRYVHIGDLLTTRVFVRVVGKQYDGTIGEFGIPSDILARAVEVSQTTAALHEPRLVRYIEAHEAYGEMSEAVPEIRQHVPASADRVSA